MLLALGAKRIGTPSLGPHFPAQNWHSERTFSTAARNHRLGCSEPSRDTASPSRLNPDSPHSSALQPAPPLYSPRRGLSSASLPGNNRNPDAGLYREGQQSCHPSQEMLAPYFNKCGTRTRTAGHQDYNCPMAMTRVKSKSLKILAEGLQSSPQHPHPLTLPSPPSDAGAARLLHLPPGICLQYCPLPLRSGGEGKCGSR